MAVVFHCHDEETQGVHYNPNDVKGDGPISANFFAA